MKKALLSKEQATALESVKKIKEENQLDLETLVRALYIGYEVEKGPEEKVLQVFKETSDYHTSYIKLPGGADFQKGKLEGIRITLDLLNVQIKGINC